MFERTLVAAAVVAFLHTHYPPPPQPTKVDRAKKEYQKSLPARILRDVQSMVNQIYRQRRREFSADDPRFDWFDQHGIPRPEGLEKNSVI